MSKLLSVLAVVGLLALTSSPASAARPRPRPAPAPAPRTAPEPLTMVGLLAGVGGIVGARVASKRKR